VIELQAVRFSGKAIQHGRHPVRFGRMAQPDAQASKVGWCGEVMEMYLRLDGNRIVEASFWADGCLSTMACADMLTSMVRGMAPEDAAKITRARQTCMSGAGKWPVTWFGWNSSPKVCASRPSSGDSSSCVVAFNGSTS
jgi:NifU-like protein involved in Fe-S cluster formation